ncbi:MAG: hypothetical protein IT210_00250 [Armatimonadetes bacterium]|nr:hypothetical protein [Armatimonadota bacterium]
MKKTLMILVGLIAVLSSASLSAPGTGQVNRYRVGKVVFTSYRIKTYYAQNPIRVVMSDRAKMVSPDAVLTGDEIDFRLDSRANKLVSAKVTGKAHIELKQADGRQILADCKQAVYRAPSQKILLNGKVRVQIKDERLAEPGSMAGERATIDLKEETVDIEGGSEGPVELLVTPKETH